MALPADFSKIYGSAATGGLTPISDVNYAKGWEFVGGNPPTKNDFSYLQNLSDLKSQWLYSNKLQRTDPFGDIKSDGVAAIETALANLGLKEAAKRDVGTGIGQIPDMIAFTSSVGAIGYQRLPGGIIFQWGFTNPSPNNTKNTVGFPIAYSTRCNGVILQYVNSGVVDHPDQGTPHQIGVYTRLGFDFYYTGTTTGMQHFWFSWGY